MFWSSICVRKRTVLGGSIAGESILTSLVGASNPKTVVGYISDFLLNPSASLSNYLTKVSNHNKNISDNVYLLAGDGNLELIAPLLAQRANAQPLSAFDKPWEKVHSIISDLQNIRINKDREMVIFIDTNPSFSIYTEIAILGGSHLLIPINADDSSVFAITGLFNLIWGSSTPHPVYGNYTFASRVNSNGLPRPSIHYLLGNRFTQRVGAAHAFKSLSAAATGRMYNEYSANPSRFRATSTPITSEDSFEKEFVIELRDFNSAGVVAANLGIPLNKMDKQNYKIYGNNVQVAQDQRDLCRATILDLVKKL